MCYKHPSLFTRMGGLKPDSKNMAQICQFWYQTTPIQNGIKKVWELEVANFLNYFTVRQ